MRIAQVSDTKAVMLSWQLQLPFGRACTRHLASLWHGDKVIICTPPGRWAPCVQCLSCSLRWEPGGHPTSTALRADRRSLFLRLPASHPYSHCEVAVGDSHWVFKSEVCCCIAERVRRSTAMLRAGRHTQRCRCGSLRPIRREAVSACVGTNGRAHVCRHERGRPSATLFGRRTCCCQAPFPRNRGACANRH